MFSVNSSNSFSQVSFVSSVRTVSASMRVPARSMVTIAKPSTLDISHFTDTKSYNVESRLQIIRVGDTLKMALC